MLPIRIGDEIGNYKGVKAYSNGSSAGTPKGEKIDYQCLAYVQRFYEKHYFALGLWGNAGLSGTGSIKIEFEIEICQN